MTPKACPFPRRYLFFLILIGTLVLILAGCGSPGLPVQEAQVTHAPANPTPLAAGVQTPAILAQPEYPTPEPSATALPSVETSTPTAPAQAAWVPAIPAAPQGAGSPTPDLQTLDGNVLVSTSPDGWWQAEALTAKTQKEHEINLEYLRVSVSQTDGNLRWVVQEEWREIGLGMSYPTTFTWSMDGLWLYYYEHGSADGCDWFGFDTNLRRVSLADGRMETLELFEPGRGGLISISPDGEKLAYLRGSLLTISNLATLESFTLPIEQPAAEWDAGGVVWAPEGEGLALTIVENACSSQGWRTGIMLVNILEKSGRYLVQSSETPWMTHRWEKERGLLVRLENGQSGQVDLQTGKISPIGSNP
jgi:hypothetical protein